MSNIRIQDLQANVQLLIILTPATSSSHSSLSFVISGYFVVGSAAGGGEGKKSLIDKKGKGRERSKGGKNEDRWGAELR